MDLALVVARQLRLVIVCLVLGTAGAVALALLLPARFSAGVQLLPPRANNMGRLAGLLGTAAQALPIDPAAALGGGSDGGLLVGILQSRTVTDALIARFDLMKVYRTRNIEDAREEFARHVSIDLDRKTTMVSVRVEDRSPRRACDIANSMAEEANKISNALEVGRAGQERRFLEKRLQEVQKDLATAEVAFKEFQTAHGMVDIGEQTRATVRTIATLRAELISREVNLSYINSFATGDEQNAVRMRREIGAIRRQLDKLEKPASGGAKGDGAGTLATVREIPDLVLEYTRKLRDLKIQETVFELLTKQLEMAKVGEARDTANAQTVDMAVLPTHRSWPRRSHIVIGIFLVSLIVALLLAKIRDNLARDPAWRAQLQQLRDALRGRAEPR